MSTTALRDTSASYAPPSASSIATHVQRVASLDIVRGLVVVLMAIDHVRVYSGLPAGGPSPGIFFTRWITHFVAPGFVFFAGMAAYLYGQRVGDKSKLARFLLTRGLWLVVLELTVIRVLWTFNLDFANYMLAGVIWMIGWCMVLMAAIVFLPHAAIAVGSVLIIAGHNLTTVIPSLQAALRQENLSGLWKILYTGGEIQFLGFGPPLAILFVIIPWIGVMAAGYAFGPVMSMSPERRRAICLRVGIGATAAFLALRGLDVYGDQRSWHSQLRAPQRRQAQGAPAANAAPATPASQPAAAPAPPPSLTRKVLAFLNTSKYPASLLFLLMTLGPLLITMALVENARGPIARALETFGRVPLFYYLLHIPVIHIAAIVVSLVREGSVNPWLFANHPMYNPPAPQGYTWSLPLLYLVWAICLGFLYVACRWYARVKAESKSALLSYL
jgi:uncharacterized membrane protein